MKKALAIASLVLGIVSIATTTAGLLLLNKPASDSSLFLFGITFICSIPGIALGIIPLARMNLEPWIHGGKRVAIVGIIANAVANSIPALILLYPLTLPTRGRSFNEDIAIGDIRTVIEAEMSYSRSNHGFFDTLACLATPASCLPDYPSIGPVFLDPVLATAETRSGFKRVFHPGPPARVDSSAAGKVSRSSISAFAYVAVPIKPGLTGIRSFCGDSSGRICAIPKGSPEVIDGFCPLSCPTLY